MKKLVIICIAIILCLSLYIVYLKDKYNTLIYSNVDNKEVINKSSNALTMMLETEAGSGEYALSNSGEWPGKNYIFNSELSGCENEGTLSWDSESNRVVMQSNSSDRCYVYFDVATLSKYIVSHYTADGENGLYYHDGQGTYTNASQEAGDNSYRYAGADPNNYVCFGTDIATCPTDNLYRVIGVFDDEVKLIKGDFATSTLLGTNGTYYRSYSASNYSRYKGNLNNLYYYTWTNSTNVWSNSELNTTNLNTNYITNIGSEWANLITEHTWIVGGNTSSNIREVAVKITYNNEIVSPAASTTYNAKIGLMYVSDYGYAASPENWQTTLGDYNDNWIFMGAESWTITPNYNTSMIFLVESSGWISSASGWEANIQPVFYLNRDVAYLDGDGSISNPYRVA